MAASPRDRPRRRPRRRSAAPRARAARDADHEPEAARAARGHAGQRVLHDDGACRRDGEPPRGFEEAVRSRLAGEAEPLDVATVDDRVEVRVDAGRAQHGSRVRARGDDGGADAGVAQIAHPADGARVRLDAAGAQRALDLRLLAHADRLHRPCSDQRLGSGLGSGDAAGSEEVAHSVVAQLPVDVGEIVALGVERLRAGAGGAAPIGEEGVERLLPAAGVQGRRRGQHAVEVEEHGVVGADSCCELAAGGARRTSGADPEPAP